MGFRWKFLNSNTFSVGSHLQLKDALRMAYPPYHWERTHPFQAFRHIKSFPVRPAADDDLICGNVWNGCIHSQWWGGWAILSASILSGFPYNIFGASSSWWWLNMSKRLKWVYVSILSDGVFKPFSVRPATDDDLIFSVGYHSSK